MAKGVFGLSTALSGVLSAGFWFSDFCLLRENVDMERAGREGAAWALAVGFFSGEKESARVAEGVLLCEDVLLVLPLESLVRMLALRERFSWTPISPRVDEMLCRDVCLRRGGVDSVVASGSYWAGGGGGAAVDEGVGVGRLMVGGGGWATAVGVLGGLCRPPKMLGRREKRPEAGVDALAVVVESSMMCRGGRWGRVLGSAREGGCLCGRPTAGHASAAGGRGAVLRCDARRRGGLCARDIAVPGWVSRGPDAP